ncbi:MAG: DUF5335 family protein [Solirubrobacteraceae bacterium]
MAKLTEEIPRDAWQSYFDDFSRRIRTVEATVEVDGRDLGAQIEAQRVVLTGVSYDSADDVLVIGLDAPGGKREELERIIDRPQRIFVEGGFAEKGMAIAVDDADGHRTIVTLARPPALPAGTAG